MPARTRSTGITIRRGMPADAIAIHQLLGALLPRIIPDPDSPEAATFLQSLSLPEIEKRLEADNYLYFVAEDDRGLCGYIALRDNQHLHHLFIRADMQRLGIGRQLWERLASETGLLACTVNSAPGAVPAYRAYGFREAGEPRLQAVPAHVPMVFTRVL